MIGACSSIGTWLRGTVVNFRLTDCSTEPSHTTTIAPVDAVVARSAIGAWRRCAFVDIGLTEIAREAWCAHTIDGILVIGARASIETCGIQDA